MHISLIAFPNSFKLKINLTVMKSSKSGLEFWWRERQKFGLLKLHVLNIWKKVFLFVPDTTLTVKSVTRS